MKGYTLYDELEVGKTYSNDFSIFFSSKITDLFVDDMESVSITEIEVLDDRKMILQSLFATRKFKVLRVVPALEIIRIGIEECIRETRKISRIQKVILDFSKNAH